MPAANAAELKSIAREAETAVSEIEDDGLKRIAFARFIDRALKSSGAAAHEPPDDPLLSEIEDMQVRELGDAAPDFWHSAGREELREAVCSYLQIEPAQFDRLVDMNGAAPSLRIGESDCRGEPADAIRKLALLLVGVRAAVGLPTNVRDVRAAAEPLVDCSGLPLDLIFESDPGLAVLGEPDSQPRRLRLRAGGKARVRRAAAEIVAR